jgi:hypothetical protein
MRLKILSNITKLSENRLRHMSESSEKVDLETRRGRP